MSLVLLLLLSPSPGNTRSMSPGLTELVCTNAYSTSLLLLPLLLAAAGAPGAAPGSNTSLASVGMRRASAFRSDAARTWGVMGKRGDRTGDKNNRGVGHLQFLAVSYKTLEQLVSV